MSGRRMIPSPRPAGLRGRVRSLVVALTAGALVGVSACSGGAPDRSASQAGAAATQTAAPAVATEAGPRAGLAAVPQVVRDVEPSVVTILVADGLGSGVVYREDGIIITNEHVIRAAADQRVEVVFAEGRRVPGTVRASDEISDLAVIEVDRTGLPVPEYRNELPTVGELAIAIGSPLGFENSVTAGIVSGLNRILPATQENRVMVDLIQTDAAISPGNSGGALLDGQGRVIGINEAYVPPEAGAVSLGFAIPSATVVDSAEQLLATGRVEHAFLGLQVATLTPEIAGRLGLGVENGVLVLTVVDGGPADEAGIVSGDVIRTFNGEKVTSTEEFLDRLRDVSPGDKVTLGIYHDGQEREVQATASDRPE